MWFQENDGRQLDNNHFRRYTDYVKYIVFGRNLRFL